MSLFNRFSKISAKVVAGTLITIVLITAVLTWTSVHFLRKQGKSNISEFRDFAEESAAKRLQDLVVVTLDILASYEEQAKSGTISRDEARRLAQAQIQRIRYAGGTGYFWIQSFEAANPDAVRMVMHPTVPRLNGTDISGYTYGDGPRKGQVVFATAFTQDGERVEATEDVPFFVQMNRVVAREEEGVVAYEWPKPSQDGLTEHQPKWSFVKLFAPWGWVVGTGVYVDDIDHSVGVMESSIRKGLGDSILWMTLASLIILLVAGFVAFRFGSWFKRRAHEVSSRLREIAEGDGDLTLRLNESGRGDELDEVARWFNAFVEGVHHMVRDVMETAQALGQSAASLSENAKQMEAISQNIKSQSEGTAGKVEIMASNSHTVAQESAAAADRVARMAKNAESAAQNALNVSGRAQDVSEMVNSLAASVEEMDAALNEVSKNCAQTADTSRESKTKAEAAMTQMKALEQAASTIDKVVALIQGIADQTNLLALNATIEAARAGEAGRGFGVVANEVKELARQTAKATEEITTQVNSIQTATDGVAEMIRQMNERASLVDDLTNMIAAAVEEQSSATGEVARNVTMGAQAAKDISDQVDHISAGVRETSNLSAEIARGVDEMTSSAREASAAADDAAKNIGSLDRSAGDASQSSGRVNSASQELNTRASNLSKLVSRFKV